LTVHIFNYFVRFLSINFRRWPYFSTASLRTVSYY